MIMKLLRTFLGSGASATHQAALHHKVGLRMNTRAGIRAVREFRAGSAASRRARTPRPALQAAAAGSSWRTVLLNPSQSRREGGRRNRSQNPLPLLRETRKNPQGTAENVRRGCFSRPGSGKERGRALSFSQGLFFSCAQVWLQ